MGKINYTLLNASALNASRMNLTGDAGKPGGGDSGYWPEGTPAAIRKSAVLWYDIALQGATNESMAEHPYLKDLTGNGHDMELRNFAWTEESGISTVNYPGALVSDGVDDCGYCKSVPILKDFTLFTNRIYKGKVDDPLVTKRTSPNKEDGAFQFERGGVNCVSFGNRNAITLQKSQLSWMTPTSYNGVTISRGDLLDTDTLSLFTLRGYSVSNNVTSAALYSLILFNRTLSENELDWVRVNIMKSYTVAELCAMGYGDETSYGYNLTGNFTEAGVPVPSDLAARLAGEDGKLLKVTNLNADAAFWEAVRAALKEVTITAVNPLPNYWNGTDIGGDVEMTVSGGDYQTATNMRGQGIRKLTLNLPSGFINSMNNAFVWAVTMEELVINGTVTTNDWTACFDHCTALKTFTAPEWSSGGADAAYDLPVSQMNSAFQQCPALNDIPQYGTEREAAGNTLRPVSMQNMLNASGVEVLGPVVDCRYINPASASQCAGAFGAKLTDARLQNLNHGDWWLDGTSGDHVTHGNLAGLDAASVEYLMANLWDLTTDKVGMNWKTVDNSFSLWTVDSPAARDGATAVTIPGRSRSGAQKAYVWTGTAVQDFKVRVTGLQPGDKLCIGAVGSTPGADAITEDGVYTRSWSGAGYVVNFNDEETQPTGAVRLEIVEQPYDPGNHMVSSAKLHVPETWRERLTDELLNAAAAKGWSVWIGDEELKAGGLDASLVDTWIFSGYKNEDAPESVAGEKGNALALGNFAYTAESGFADGCLVTDGVDDYAENLEMPVLTTTRSSRGGRW